MCVHVHIRRELQIWPSESDLSHLTLLPASWQIQQPLWRRINENQILKKIVISGLVSKCFLCEWSTVCMFTKTRLLKIVSRESLCPWRCTLTIDWAKITYTYSNPINWSLISAIHRQAAYAHLSQDRVVIWGQTETEYRRSLQTCSKC